MCFFPASGGSALGPREHVGLHGGRQQFGVGLPPQPSAVGGTPAQHVANTAVLDHVVLSSPGTIQEPVGVYRDTVSGDEHYALYDVNGRQPAAMGARVAESGGDFVSHGPAHGFPLHYHYGLQGVYPPE